MAARTLVFVHGWSVTHTRTYGALPERLAAEARAAGEELRIEHVWLSRYVSFHDQVRMSDLAFAMQRAVERDLAAVLKSRERFAVITHSTGGPVVRTWWYEYFARRGENCPMSHLIMLAPANFGSALAQLGKSRVSRLRSWVKGVEPGQGVLDWLEHGSAESWNLNEAWIRGQFGDQTGRTVFPFVLTGQSITRALYDHLNSYTGEVGSDGVVRAAAANLNASYVRLQQRGAITGEGIPLQAVGGAPRAPGSAFRLIGGASHWGAERGIMESVPPGAGGPPAPVADAIRRCLAVDTPAQYARLCRQFGDETLEVSTNERVEVEKIRLLPDRTHIHDAMSLVIFRLRDGDGYPVEDFDLLLTGEGDSPDRLPAGFLADRQRNLRSRNVLTFYFNHAVMVGCPEVRDPRDPAHVLRDRQRGIDVLGLRVTARPAEGFVHYLPAYYRARKPLLDRLIRAHETALVDIVLRRVVHKGAFEIHPATEDRGAFSRVPPGEPLEE